MTAPAQRIKIASMIPQTAASETVGARVRGRLAEAGITQRAAAVELGLSQPALHRRLSGAIPFDVAELAALGKLLGVPAAHLMADSK